MVVFNTFTVPVDGIVHQQKDTRAFVNDKEIGCGTLYITETLVSWCEDTKKIGFSLQYPHISLHGVRLEPHPGLYLMVDHYLTIPDGLLPDGMPQPGDEEKEMGSDDEEYDEEQQPLTELMFVPRQGQEMINRMFTAMNQCQALHPDPEDEGDDDSDVYEDASDLMDDDNFEPVEEGAMEERMQELSMEENGHPNGTNHMENDEAYDPEQFADDE